MLTREDCRYQACFCEENAWHLARHPALADVERHVVFVTNARRACPMWFQRAAPSPIEPVVWDYHVVVWGGLHTPATQTTWDLDSTLPFGSSLSDWLRATFIGADALPDDLLPRFRVVEASALLAHFASDRRHMRDPHGGWLQPPPPWPPIARPDTEHTLDRFLDLDDDWIGELWTLDEATRRAGGQGARL